MKEPDEAVARSGPDQRTSQGASGSVARVTDDGTKRRQVHKVPSTEVGQAPHRAHRAGWSIGKLGSGHLRWTSPTREAVVTSCTPSGSSRVPCGNCERRGWHDRP
jgi:hypothetical protein